MNRLILYCLFFVVYVFVVVYSISGIIWKDDHLMYLVIFDNILSNPFPFGAELVLSALMYIAKLVELSYVDFLFLKEIIWIPIIFLLDYHINGKDKTLFFSFIFLCCFLYIPLHESMMFLSRQTLAFFFALIVIMVDGRLLKIFFSVLMIFSHTSSFFWLPILFGFLTRTFNKKIIVLFCFVSLFFVFVKKEDFSLYFLNLISDLPFVPGVFKYNFDAKVGFYLSGQSQGNNGITNSLITTSAISFSLVVIFFCYSKYKYFLSEKTKNMIALFMQGVFFYFVFFNNTILANRMGFLPYFFIAPFLGFYFCLFFKRKFNSFLVVK